ncbi:hypothetical protein V1477_011395 [Vespula maculifrons]|uniref:Uncharacterized protein n=1 Tax=Vespula maculifrons TaxID=7453 RepID=A0ABD2C4P2_VESMC
MECFSTALPSEQLTILSLKHKSVKINRKIIDKKRISETVVRYRCIYKEITGQNISIPKFLLQIEEELAKDYHEFLQKEKKKVQGTSSD